MALPNKPSIKNVWATSGLKVEPSDTKVNTGWIVERPPHQFQNFLQNRSDQFLKHINEAGIPVWDAVTIYTAGKSYVQGSDGLLYKAKTTGANQDPVGNPTNWMLTLGETDFQEVVQQTEDNALAAANSASEAATSEANALATVPVFDDVAPTPNLAGKQWTSALTGKRYEWIVDADSGQWVEMGPQTTFGATAFGAALASPSTVDAYAFSATEAQSIFDNALPLSNYTALRAYTGRALGVRITNTGISGIFQRDIADTTSADNGGTIIVDIAGRRWKRLFVGPANAIWFGGVWDGTGDVSSFAQLALNSGIKVIDFLNLPARVVSSLVIPTGIEARNINLIAGTPGMDVVRPNSNSIVTGKITGTGTGGSIIERAINPATDGVNDVFLDLDITSLTVGVQIWALGLTLIPKRWHGSVRVSGLVGGGANSNGYGLLIAGADDCEFTVTSVDTPRHCVYISNGSKRNRVFLQSHGNGGAPVQLAAFSSQDYVENNFIEAQITGMVATSTSSAYGANIVGKCRLNEITVHVDNSAIAEGALLFRANDADTVPYRNVCDVWHKDGYSGPGVIRSDSGFENEVYLRGEGVASAGSGTAVISVGVYSSIIPNGNYDCSLHVRSYSWDCKGAAMRGVAALASYAPVNIGQGIMRGHKNSTFPKVYLSGGGTVIGYTHKDVFRQSSTAIAAGGSLDIVRTYPIPFDNAAFSTVKVIAPSATPSTMPSYVATSDALISNTVKIKNGDPSNSQNFLVIFDTEGY